MSRGNNAKFEEAIQVGNETASNHIPISPSNDKRMFFIILVDNPLWF
jgi:hypothetical protein